MSVREVIIPILGRGSRLWPASGVIPKELLPIGINPLLTYSIQEAVTSGITDIHVLTNSPLIEHFLSDSNPAINARVSDSTLESLAKLKNRALLICHRMEKTNGLAEALYQYRDFIQGNSFALMFPDDIIFGEKAFLSELVKMHEIKFTNIIGLTRITTQDVKEFGVVEYQKIDAGKYRLLSVVEKKVPARIQSPLLGIIGRYILTRDIFPILKSQLSGRSADKFSLTPTLNRLAGNGSLLGVLNRQKYFHVGTEEGYIKAFLYYAKMRNAVKKTMHANV
jgi:UTP--glucose-1-phosphate uridylyltransferase